MVGGGYEKVSPSSGVRVSLPVGYSPTLRKVWAGSGRSSGSWGRGQCRGAERDGTRLWGRDGTPVGRPWPGKGWGCGGGGAGAGPGQRGGGAGPGRWRQGRSQGRGEMWGAWAGSGRAVDVGAGAGPVSRGRGHRARGWTRTMGRAGPQRAHEGGSEVGAKVVGRRGGPGRGPHQKMGLWPGSRTT